MLLFSSLKIKNNNVLHFLNVLKKSYFKILNITRASPEFKDKSWNIISSFENIVSILCYYFDSEDFMFFIATYVSLTSFYFFFYIMK